MTSNTYITVAKPLPTPINLSLLSQAYWPSVVMLSQAEF